MKYCGRLACGLAILLSWSLESRAWAGPPISAFARGEFIISASLSPDGHFLSQLMTVKGVRVAEVRDLSVPAAPLRAVMSGAADYRFTIDWCRWATNTRLLCGLAAFVHEQNYVYVATRLAAVDADGKNMKVLVQNQGAAGYDSQLQDQIIDWSPGKPDTVLIAAQGSTLSSIDAAILKGGAGDVAGGTMNPYPSVYELNVVTGQMRLRLEGRAPLREYLTDHRGEVRLGWGVIENTDEIQYNVRDVPSGEWRRLVRFKAFPAERILEPIGICPDKPDCAFATGDYEGRAALWRIDLTGKTEPVLEFSHPTADVAGPLFASDGRLLGVLYETDQPFIHYTDPQRELVMRSVKRALPGGVFAVLLSASSDERKFIVRTSTDVDAGTFYFLNLDKGSLEQLGRAYPELDPSELARMQTISYPAQDGTSIPGYLTVPRGVRAEHLPLIVMPHGGPIARDSWEFDFLRAFLASRGYAVLQMNFRGSDGYGSKWQSDAHQDWGGLTYSDITDGARWAVKQGIADPARMCIIGWSFGGYAALLGATRNADLYKCSVSIAGVSDLSLLEAQEHNFVGGGVSREQIGTNRAKLKADSPRRHAADVEIPILMIHGDNDAQSNVEQSQAMDSALKRAGKLHQFILISGADHQMSRESDRTTLLTETENFLATYLGPGVVAP